MKWVLLIFLTTYGGLDTSDLPAVTTATFEDERACQAAMDQVKRWYAEMSKISQRNLKMACMPSASKKDAG